VKCGLFICAIAFDLG